MLFRSGRDAHAWKAALRPNTRLFFLETPANPTLHIVDILAVCDIAHEAGAQVVVDNAFASPVLQGPMEFGADIVAYSATKQMPRQGHVLAGAVVGTRAFLVNPLVPFSSQTQTSE